jgi:hypothetical protein
VVEPSEEIRRVIQRWMSAMADDDDSALGRLSEHPGALMIGTDPAEWWRGEEIRAIWARQLEEVGAPFAADEIEAWEEGTVGWDVRSPPRARRVEDRASALVPAEGER